MNSNDFVPFATAAGANIEPAAQWKNETAAQLGFTGGLSNPVWANTALRQASSIAAAIAQFMADYGTSNVQDNGNISTLESQFVTAISLLVSQTLPTQLLYNGTDVGAANAASVTETSPTLSTVTADSVFVIKKSSAANTGPMMLQIVNTTAPLLWEDGSQLGSGDWPAGTLALVVFDGTTYRLMSVMGPSIFARVSQIPSPASLNHYGTDSSTAGNTITVGTVVPAISTPFTQGTQFEITKGVASNTAAVTATISGQAGSVIWADGSALAAGDWPANAPGIVEWDGTNFRLVSMMGPSVFARSTANVGRLLNKRIWNTPGSVTYSPTPGTNKIIVTVVGGGGAGVGCVTVDGTHFEASSGGGGGGVARSVLTSGFVGAMITVGAGGAAQQTDADGNPGGTSSFGSLLSASGGQGGTGGQQVTGPFVQSGGAGGQGSGGNILNGMGQQGGEAAGSSNDNFYSGCGGGSHFGYGPSGWATTTNQGNSATTPGTGGGGAINQFNNAAKFGGNGAPGIVIVEEYS